MKIFQLGLVYFFFTYVKKYCASFFQKNLYIIFALSAIFLDFLENNIGRYFSIFDFISIFLVLLSFFIATNYFLYRIFKDYNDSFQYIISLFIFLFFNYSYICDEVYTKLSIYSYLKLPFSLIWVVIVCCFLIACCKVLKNNIATIFFKKLIFFVFLSQFALYFHASYTYKNIKKELVVSKSFGTFAIKPNVYFILIDGYPNTKVLKEVTGVDNSEFENALTEKGFIIPKESFANYHFTLASVSSQLMADYHPINKHIAPEVLSKIIAGDNNVVKTFKENGYKYIFAPSGIYSEIGSQGLEDVCVSHVPMDLLKAVISKTILRRYLGSFISKYLEPQMITNIINKYSKEKIFVYMHFMQTHDLVVTADGCVLSGQPMTIQNLNSKIMLKESIKSMNYKILKMIDCIKNNDKNAFIVINSDHGICTGRNSNSSQEYTDKSWNIWGIEPTIEQQRKRFRNFVAIYNNDQNSEPAGLTAMTTVSNVNIFRYIFKMLGIQGINLLPNKCFLFDFNERDKIFYCKQDVTKIFK